jgi:hypothetical protein
VASGRAPPGDCSKKKKKKEEEWKNKVTLRK